MLGLDLDLDLDGTWTGRDGTWTMNLLYLGQCPNIYIYIEWDIWIEHWTDIGRDLDGTWTWTWTWTGH